jgi:hypothetical protein
MRRSSLVFAAIFATVSGAANAQQPSYANGSFSGVMTEMPTPTMGDVETPACVYQRPVGMTVVNGVVTISYLDWGQNTIHFHGQIDGGGRVVAWHENGDGSRSPLTGRIGSNGFVGYMARDNQLCPYVLNMTASPAR